MESSNIEKRLHDIEARLNRDEHSQNKLANMSPLGLFAFAITTANLQVRHMLDASDAATGIAVGAAFGFGGLIQLIAGLFNATRGQTFGGVAFCSYGGFWLSFAVHECLVRTYVFPRNDVAESSMLFMWGIFTTALFTCSFNTNIAVSTLFASLAMLFYLLGAAKNADSEALEVFTAIVGFITSIIAFYAGLGELMNDLYGKTLIPIGAFEHTHHGVDRSFNEPRKPRIPLDSIPR